MIGLFVVFSLYKYLPIYKNPFSNFEEIYVVNIKEPYGFMGSSHNNNAPQEPYNYHVHDLCYREPAGYGEERLEVVRKRTLRVYWRTFYICAYLRNMPELCVLIAPGLESHDDRLEGPSAWSEAVLHFWRNFRVDRP